MDVKKLRHALHVQQLISRDVEVAMWLFQARRIQTDARRLRHASLKTSDIDFEIKKGGASDDFERRFFVSNKVNILFSIALT